MSERDYEWDERKSDANLAKHGLDFHAARRLGWDAAIVVEDGRQEYNERRLRAYGLIDGTVCVLVFTVRDEIVRVISLRRANARERKRYGF